MDFFRMCLALTPTRRSVMTGLDVMDDAVEFSGNAIEETAQEYLDRVGASQRVRGQQLVDGEGGY